MSATISLPVETEQELLRRAGEGDGDAVQALFDLYAETLRAYARRWLPARLDRKVSVSDVLQEARLVAARRAVEFEDRGLFADGELSGAQSTYLSGFSLPLYLLIRRDEVANDVWEGFRRRPDWDDLLANEEVRFYRFIPPSL